MNLCVHCGIIYPENSIQTQSLLGLLKKAGGRFHDTGLEPMALLPGVLFLEVMQVSHTISTTNRIDVEIDILTPFLVKRAKKKRPDSASLGTTEPLQFPDVRKEVLELFRRRPYRDAGRLDTLANLFETAVLNQRYGLFL